MDQHFGILDRSSRFICFIGFVGAAREALSAQSTQKVVSVLLESSSTSAKHAFGVRSLSSIARFVGADVVV